MWKWDLKKKSWTLGNVRIFDIYTVEWLLSFFTKCPMQIGLILKSFRWIIVSSIRVLTFVKKMYTLYFLCNTQVLFCTNAFGKTLYYNNLILAGNKTKIIKNMSLLLLPNSWIIEIAWKEQKVKATLISFIHDIAISAKKRFKNTLHLDSPSRLSWRSFVNLFHAYFSILGCRKDYCYATLACSTMAIPLFKCPIYYGQNRMHRWTMKKSRASIEYTLLHPSNTSK